ncbi:MAG: hypothetical protein AAF490_05785 [Chloroflexota bacterium]
MSYIVGHPIKHPRDFYGRLEQKKRFFEIISGPQSQSITILGARRSGKTSFLRHVAHPAVMAAHLKEPENYIMVYIDVSACRTPSEFYQRTIVKLSKLLPDIQEINLWKAPEHNQYTMFHLETILCQFPNKRIILLLDEFDKIRTNTFDQDFLTELRALASVWEYELACITASFVDLYQLGADVGLPPTSPFYNIFYPTPIYMHGVSTATLTQIILTPSERLGVKLPQADVSEIINFAGTLPFFTQAIASAWVHEYHGKSISAKERFKHLVANLSSYFEQWWQQFSELERGILTAVSKNQPLKSLEQPKNVLSQTVHWLKSFAFLLEDEGQLFVNGEIFRYWLQHRSEENGRFQRASNGHKNSGQTHSLEFFQNGAEKIEILPIYQKIITYFKIQDIQLICFELGIDEECLTYSNKQELIRELILLLNREDRLNELIKSCQNMRPNLPWGAKELR